MGKCIVCGKHGLFLKLKAGLCADCSYSNSKNIYIGSRRVNTIADGKSDIHSIEHAESTQPIYQRASSLTESIRKLKSESTPWNDPFSSKVDSLISLCNNAISMYPQIEIANKLTGDFMESTLCIFPAAECLIEIYLYRKWYDNAFGVIRRLRTFGLSKSYNIEKINLLSRRIAHTQNVSENYPYSMDECIGIIRDRILTESIPCSYPGSSRQFTRTHFNEMCNHFGLREDLRYCINSVFQLNPQYIPKPRYKYTENIIVYIIEKIESDSRILIEIHESN